MVVAMGLTACGGGGSSSAASPNGSQAPPLPIAPATTAHGPAHGAPTESSAKASASGTDAVAVVAGVPITKPVYEHWVASERAHGATAATAGRSALGFLITYEWVLGEAAARHITVSEAELKKRLAKLDKQSFPKPGSLRRFMVSTGETEADLLGILRVGLLKNQIEAKVTAGDAGPKAQQALAAFQKAFQADWKRYTTCGKQYVMEDCSESK